MNIEKKKKFLEERTIFKGIDKAETEIEKSYSYENILLVIEDCLMRAWRDCKISVSLFKRSVKTNFSISNTFLCWRMILGPQC